MPVIEGMTIAAYAIGAHEGYVYLSCRYPLAIERPQNRHPTSHRLWLAGARHPAQRLCLH